MGVSTNFDLSQTSFLFSWMSNSAANSTGTAQNLADTVFDLTFNTNKSNSLLSQYGNDLIGGDWTLVWGPGVYQSSWWSPVSDNTAFVAYSQSQDIYIIAVAGTNPKSIFASHVEDLEVRQQIAWPYDPLQDGVPKINASEDKNTLSDGGEGNISYGTAIGIWAVLTQLTPCSKAEFKDLSLGEYLLSENFGVKDGTRIIFTGHSLGGALAPTLANWLLGQKPSYANNIFTQIIAGPTAGDGVYQKKWDSAFKIPTPLDATMGFNQNIICNQDVVPHAWGRIYAELPDNPFDCYFSKISGDDTDVNSKMGQINNCSFLLEDLAFLQPIVDALGYTETANIHAYDAVLPLSYYYLNKFDNTIREEGTVDGKFTNGVSTLDDFNDYENALEKIHIWSYGQNAFNIDLSVFASLGFV